MAKQKTTKRALLLSCLSLLLCVSMLVGSTFAWFTDSASTGVNTITAGNLDIALYKGDVTKSGETVTGIAYNSEVTTETKLFDDNALWEPGHTEVAYLKIENKGTLSLRYQLKINVFDEVVGYNADGEEIKLSEILCFQLKQIGAADFYATRSDAIAAANGGGALKSTIKNGLMLAGETAYLALVVYMPTAVGNEANYRGATAPSIKLGVDLFATQNPYEYDSFDNLYDDQADGTPDYPELGTIDYYRTSAPIAEGEDTELSSADGSVKISGPKSAFDPDATQVTLTVEKQPEVDDAVLTLIDPSLNAATYDVELEGHKPGEPVTVSIYAGTGGNPADVKVYHYDEEVQGVTYDPQTGYATFVATDFSPYTLTGRWFAAGAGTEADPYQIDDINHLMNITILNSSSRVNYYKLTNDIVVDRYRTSTLNGVQTKCVISTLAHMVIDGDGHTVKSNGVFFANLMGYATIKNLTYDIKNSSMIRWVQNEAKFNNVDLTGYINSTGAKNMGSYIQYLYMDADFTDCDTAVNFTAGGTKTNYIAGFVGCCCYKSNVRLNFTNCTNTGNIIGGTTAMFLGNPYTPGNYGYDIVLNINNCRNDGLIQSTYTVADAYPYNHFCSVLYNTVSVNLNGEPVDSSTPLPCGENGRFVKGPVDDTLALKRNDDGTMTLTPSADSEIAYYTVEVLIYAGLSDNKGSGVFSVSQRIQQAAEPVITDIKLLGFVDKTYLEALGEGNYTLTAADYNENVMLVTVDGNSYYLITDDHFTLNGIAKAYYTANVSAYNASGTLVASTGLTK